MIIAYLNRETLESIEITAHNQALLKEAVWIDLLSPEKAEEHLIEHYLVLDIPTREEMGEIELSSRLYKEDNALFMTVTMIAQSDSPEPKFDPVSFVLTDHQLITIRYIEPRSFRLFASRVKKMPANHRDPIGLLIELLDANVDRLADILELVGRRLEDYSRTTFKSQALNAPPQKLDYRQLMNQMAANGDLSGKARESLLTFHRLVPFFSQTSGSRIDPEGLARLSSLSSDIAALNDHANFLSMKINFLLDATLGMVNIEQNNIIKIFSVAAVIFLPPTLIASIYGMNFHFIPELSWKYGYLFAIGLILVAAWLPYKYFKFRKWL